MRRTQATVPAPVDLGAAGMAAVPPGSEIALDLRLESVMEGVLITGTARATMSGECGRCLEPVASPIEVEFQELYSYRDQGPSRGASQPVADDDKDELPVLVDDLVDLEPLLRDAVVLELPMTPLCSDDCAGLCVDCGERLADLPDNHSHDAVDPRWAALAELRDEPGSAESSPAKES